MSSYLINVDKSAFLMSASYVAPQIIRYEILTVLMFESPDFGLDRKKALIFYTSPLDQTEKKFSILELLAGNIQDIAYNSPWFVMTEPEYYSDTGWHYKSSASSLLMLSNALWSGISVVSNRVPQAQSSPNREIISAVWRQCHCYFRSPKSPSPSPSIFLAALPSPRVFPTFSLYLRLCPLKAQSHHPLWLDALAPPPFCKLCC